MAEKLITARDVRDTSDFAECFAAFRPDPQSDDCISMLNKLRAYVSEAGDNSVLLHTLTYAVDVLSTDLKHKSELVRLFNERVAREARATK